MQAIYSEKKPCADPKCSGAVHVENNTCPKCGKCLYAHARQIPDDYYPIFECVCGERVFWD